MNTTSAKTETVFEIFPIELGKILASHLGIPQSDANMCMYYKDGSLDRIIVKTCTEPLTTVKVSNPSPTALADALLNCLMQCGKNGKMTLDDGGMFASRTQDGTVVFGGQLVFKQKGASHAG